MVPTGNSTLHLMLNLEVGLLRLACQNSYHVNFLNMSMTVRLLHFNLKTIYLK